jgi:integrase
VSLGPPNLRHGPDGRQWLTYTQHKNRARKPVTLTIPVHPELRHIIEATPGIGKDVFLLNENGKGFANGASFGNWMRPHFKDAAAVEALTPHTLRKGISRRLAEAGMSVKQIAAITGHKTLKEIERYCADAEQKRLAEQGRIAHLCCLNNRVASQRR